jgi:cyclic pyranopterin phosphate synthase
VANESHISVKDHFGRPLASLRISVTDHCNLRCQYCMPEEEYVWLERAEILHFEEIARLARAFAQVGATKVRLTGGEPLLRRDLDHLVRMLREDSRISDLSLTTNGLLLARYARCLRQAGLDRVTVSLDTLRPARFRQLAGRDGLDDTIAGIRAARQAGFARLKINTVVIGGLNDDELIDLLEFGRSADAEVRFIEYMDVGGATRWSPQQVVSRTEMLERIARHYGPVRVLPEAGRARSAPAERFALPDGMTFGIIASTTQPFCAACDRARLTTDGVLLLCLYARHGVNLKELLRGGAPLEEIAGAIADAWRVRYDRGAEERQHLESRGVLFQIEELRADPHREMHTRGG